MKAEFNRMVQLFEDNWDGKMWYGSNVEKALSDIKWEKAFRKPGAGSHNIYELAQHILCWRKFVLEYFKGNQEYSVGINSELDWPTKYEKTEANWKQTLKDLEKNQEELMKVFRKFKAEKLDEKVPGKKFTWRDFVNGVLHHDIYHAAQIAILKK